MSGKFMSSKSPMNAFAFAVALVAANAQVVRRPHVAVSGDLVFLRATAKGPDQVNLRWPAATQPGYGYLVEIQSDADPRYPAWRELQPVPTAAGYTCDPAVVWPRTHTAGCDISDPSGAMVYNPALNGVPAWVTEGHYVDPQDGTPAQFIAHGLRNNTAYRFRVRTFKGSTTPAYGAYSNVAAATTANYALRYVDAATGNNNGDGLTPATAWASFGRASGEACGTLVLLRGDFTNENFGLSQACPASNKVVYQADYGQTARIVSNSHPDWGAALTIWGTGVVLDGIGVTENYNNDDVLRVQGAHNALLGVDIGPSIIPSGYGGVAVHGNGNLIYGSYLHDFGTPDDRQNRSGNGGFLLSLDGDATNNVIWSNHLTRGAHDGSFVKTATHNSFLNNIADGGWGMAFETIYGGSLNLFEGFIAVHQGALETNIYKPSFELSFSGNSVRRSVFAHAGKAIEITAYWTAVNNLVYNNIFYDVWRCYFQSSEQGTAAYDGVKVQNNACLYTNDVAEIYTGNQTPGAISHNAFWQLGGDGSGSPVAWNWNALGGRRVSLADADAHYAPAFTGNAALSTAAPAFVAPASLDFHLLRGSPLCGAGVAITDPAWSFAGGADLGPHRCEPAAASGGRFY